MTFDLPSLLLVATAVAFAYSIGAHYTGASMGMPYAAGAIRASRALLVMAPLTVLGAVLASEGVETTVGHGLLQIPVVPLVVALAIIAGAFALTTAYNFAAIPTSTIQILVFSVVGAGLAAGIPVHWAQVGFLLGLWAIAPPAAFGLGYLLVRVARAGGVRASDSGSIARPVAFTLIAVGAGASFAMGANDVSNATGAFLMTGLLSPATAALVGGLGIAAGVLTWGQPLLRRVAFDVVKLDPVMATSAQLAQSVVVLVSVAFGYFTSMNQALVAAMLGTGVARRQEGIRWRVVRSILLGWTVGPLSGAAAGFGLTWLLRAVGILGASP
ncbi:MAG TPA: anion permease [Thermoplasmata archaeon]|nr:anion permease [Thermoplasmata archaeon]